MARAIHRLTAMAVAKQKKPGWVADGGGLWLQITDTQSKSWSFRFALNGRNREMGLGPLHTVDLPKAREKARRCRELLEDGIDPIEHRKAERAQRLVESNSAKTFDQCTADFIAAKSAGWSNPKHVSQWKNTLAAYASPVFGSLPVGAVDTELVVQALDKIWTTKTETASRVRQRIEAILDWATVSGFRKGENPARWGGHLEHKLSKPSKIRAVENLPALPFSQIAAFLVELRKQQGVAARALEFAILTAARSGEVRGARWREFDLDAQVWTVPAERMKMKREHRVPLCARAVAILREMRVGPGASEASEEFVFPGGRLGKGLSDGALLSLLKRMNRADITPHGFRSTFRDWASEQTSYPHEVQEIALAHTIKSKAEAAYRRGDLFEKRRQMMADWEVFCRSDGPAMTVFSYHKGV